MSNFTSAIEKLTQQAGADDMQCVLAEILIDAMTEETAAAIVRSDKSLTDIIKLMREEARKKASGGCGAISPQRAIEIAAGVFGFVAGGSSKAEPKATPSTGAVNVNLMDLL